MYTESKLGKLIVHIGPPKTGSTSLQYYMQSLERTDIYYCGAFQPRADNKSSIAHQLYHYCNDPSQVDIGKEELIASISVKLAEYNYVFISEEMFTLQTKKSTWQEKLTRLYDIIGRYNPRILFFIRHIVDVLPSYYQEIYRGIPKKLQNSFLDFEKSNYALVYNYKHLLQKLISYGFSDIRYLQFESLVKSEYSLSHILCENPIQKDQKVLLGAKNKSKIKNGSRILEKRHPLEALFDKLRESVPEKYRGKGVLLPLIQILRVSTRQEKKLEVSGFSRAHYEESILYLKDIH